VTFPEQWLALALDVKVTASGTLPVAGFAAAWQVKAQGEAAGATVRRVRGTDWELVSLESSAR
jgi:hypothetical protein